MGTFAVVPAVEGGMLPRALLAAAFVLGACATPAAAPSATVESLPVPPAEPQGGKRFDDLDLTIRLDSPTVTRGASLEGALVVENRSDYEVIDPGCRLAASSSAIVPPGDPGAELWRRVVVDCAGAHTIRPGDRMRYEMTFTAATKHGDPLPPGDYVVAVEYRGLSRRLETPVTVTE